jgi:hypothetical protein
MCDEKHPLFPAECMNKVIGCQEKTIEKTAAFRARSRLSFAENRLLREIIHPISIQ